MCSYLRAVFILVLQHYLATVDILLLQAHFCFKLIFQVLLLLLQAYFRKYCYFCVDLTFATAIY
jgi:hypothetical protein